MRAVLAIMVAACGSSSTPAKPPPPAEIAVEKPNEQEHHDEIVAAHHKLESEQQDALAAKCDAPEPHEKRCMPSCYAGEPADLRAGKKLGAATEINHVFCERAGGGYVVADEVEATKLALRPVRGRFPAAHKKGSWQATIEHALTDAERPKLPKGDAIIVSSGWRELDHPITKEHLKCVTVSRYTKSRHALDGCGATGSLACEATGNAAVHGINVVHYRLAEARQLQAANKTDDCQKAALEAIAVARGLPRWRQYVKLNVGAWVEHAGYRTRFDGTLDEDALFATAGNLGDAAEQVYTACGGTATPTTKAEQEQSFHTCW